MWICKVYLGTNQDDITSAKAIQTLFEYFKLNYFTKNVYKLGRNELENIQN